MTEQKKNEPPSIRESLLHALDAEAAFEIDRLPRTGSPGVEDGWGVLRSRVETCTACVLHEHRTLAVFGEGNPDAELMFVGEAPGRDEDVSGRPFVGRAGQLLTQMIEAMKLDRSEVFIGNVIKCRPPNNRTPAPDEIARCLPYLEKQIAAIAPRVIVALGSPAARTLLQTETTITALRGRTYPYPKDETITVVPTFHPAYLLRNAAEKPKSWHDLKLAMEILEFAAR